MTKIIFEFENISIEAELNDSPTSKDLINLLPLEGISQIWGEEIYFSTSINKENDDWAKETVELGDIAFWPPGNAICLFFGKTPVSQGDEIRPASPTNVMGKIVGDLEILKTVNSGDKVKVIVA
ncbi:MAG: cyclophilin-like fold protein [Dehalococcoidia bacterium]|nr:cyclophilin-like fold protein [Dehalococcoidia bacterium]